MQSWQCPDCGEQEYVLFDGYPIGDRMLEGVMFEVRKNDDGTLDVRISPDCADYFSQLNEAKWLREIKEALESGNFDDELSCPRCGSDI